MARKNDVEKYSTNNEGKESERFIRTLKKKMF